MLREAAISESRRSAFSEVDVGGVDRYLEQIGRATLITSEQQSHAS